MASKEIITFIKINLLKIMGNKKKQMRNGYLIIPVITISLFIMIMIACDNKTGVEPQPEPVITNISPLQGTVGDIVFIDGQNFGWEPIVSVTINDSVAVVQRVSDTQIEAVVPENVEGTGDIVVKIGEKVFVWPEKFTYFIVKLTGPQTSTFAGTTQGFRDGPGDVAQFKLPQGLAIDAEGNIIVADMDNLRIRKITPDGVVSTIAGIGKAGFKDGPADSARFKYPGGVAIDANGNIYVADNLNHRIRKISTDGQVTTFAGTGEAGTDDGPADQATFFKPLGITIDPSNGNMFVVSYHGNKVRKITPDGQVTTIAGNGQPGFADGTGAEARFENPYGIVLGKDGNLYVADRANARIRKVTQDGVVTTLAGNGEVGDVDGTGPEAKFNNPTKIALDKDGNLLVTVDHGLRKVTLEGVVTTIVGGPDPGFVNGPQEDARFNQPRGVVVDANGIIYLSDRSNNVIRRIEILE